MQAKDLMTTDVVTVPPHAERPEIARALLDHGISAVPVVDDRGAPIGMVSEGDLIGRDEAARETRRDWWLLMLAEGEALSPDFLDHANGKPSTARELMASPLVTIDESTEAHEIARLLTSYRIKRVPVLRDGHIVGIVSRADLLRTMEPPSPASGRPHAAIFPLLWHHEHRHEVDTPPPPAPVDGVSAENFRDLLHNFRHLKYERERDARHAAVEHRKEAVDNLIGHHIDDEHWRALLRQARTAAENGDKEFLLLRFPCGLCSDGGRAINVAEPDWPLTLRGEAAELFLRWERDLKPQNFGLVAKVLDFPGGFPGDIGLFLIWGE